MVGLSGQGPWMRLLGHQLLSKPSLRNLMKFRARIMLFVLKMAIKFDGLITCPTNVTSIDHDKCLLFGFVLQKKLQNSKRLQIFSTPRATWFYEMSKAVRSQCFFLKKNLYFEYQPFIENMHAESPKNDTTNKNLNVLCDVELILGLPCLLPLLECVHKFIKIVHSWDVFVCNLLEVVKLAQLELYKLYCDATLSSWLDSRWV
jgi:hypothetical protein